MKSRHTRFSASAAIAALAFGSTPLAAQLAPMGAPVEPAPVLMLPPETAAPAPVPDTQPAIVVPDIEAAPPPAAVTTAPPPAAATRTARTATPATISAPAPRASAAAPAEEAPPVAADEPVETLASEMAAEPLPPVVTAEPELAAQPVDGADNTLFWAAVLGGLAAMALALWGFVAIGRRKPVESRAAAMVERPVLAPRVAEPVTPVPVDAAPMVTPLATARPATPSLSHTGASVPLPSRMPETFEERDALLRRMIAARPDRANPFASPRQRRRRARLILQSLGQDFGGRQPWFDLSQYPQNWPELAGRKHAAA